jgi:Domain of unknown function (DUF5668)
VLNLNRSARGAIIGFFLIALGGIFLLDQFGIMRADFAFRLFWPAVFIAIGLVNLLQPPNRGRTFWGGLILLLGLMMMVNNLGIFHVGYQFFWPFWIIAAGVWMLVRRSYPNYPRYRSRDWPSNEQPPYPDSPPPPGPPPSPQSSPSPGAPPSSGSATPPGSPPPAWQPPAGWTPPRPGPGNWWSNPGNATRSAWTSDIPPSMEATIDYTAVFHHIERRIVSKNFRGGKVAVVFGGFTIDLRDADIDIPVAVLHADAIFGGGEIFVPDTWDVSIRGAGVFGGYSNETRQRPLDANSKRLIIEGGAVFGGIVVKN